MQCRPVKALVEYERPVARVDGEVWWSGYAKLYIIVPLHLKPKRLAHNIEGVADALKLPGRAMGAVYIDALLPPRALWQLPQ